MPRARKRGFRHYYLRGLLDVDPVTGCWIWLGRQWGGYGRISVKRKDGAWSGTTAQKHFWETYRGKVPKRQEVSHRCHRRSCVNPRHLRLDTHRGNIADWKIDQNFTRAQKEEVAQMLAADIPVSVIADRMMCPRPYIFRLTQELHWEKYQTSFDFGDTAS